MSLMSLTSSLSPFAKVARRLALYVLAGWAALTLDFCLPRMMPGDPATAMLARYRGRIDPSALAALRETFGFTDAPITSQYLTYLKHVLRGEFGVSVAYFPAPVSEVIGTGLAWTLVLTGASVIVSFALGTVLGAVAAWRRGGVLESVALPASVLVSAFPYFWLAMLTLYVFGFVWGWFPLAHAYDDDVAPGLTLTFVASAFRHAILPALTIVCATIGGWMLSMRNTMTSVLAEDYVAFARAKGLSERRILVRYGMRNALLPSVTSFGMALGFVLSGSLLTEVVFSYPGQGYLLVQAVRNQDFPLMQGLFLTMTVAVLVANALVDVLSTWLDPRTRAR